MRITLTAGFMGYTPLFIPALRGFFCSDVLWLVKNCAVNIVIVLCSICSLVDFSVFCRVVQLGYALAVIPLCLFQFYGVFKFAIFD